VADVCGIIGTLDIVWVSGPVKRNDETSVYARCLTFLRDRSSVRNFIELILWANFSDHLLVDLFQGFGSRFRNHIPNTSTPRQYPAERPKVPSGTAAPHGEHQSG